MNAMCTFVSFRLPLSFQQASIAMWTILISKPRWWLLKPKHSTSTLIHNIFTYLDYAFQLSSFPEIYICFYIYIYMLECNKNNPSLGNKAFIRRWLGTIVIKASLKVYEQYLTLPPDFVDFRHFVAIPDQSEAS